MRHRACQECGKYRGKQVVDVVARLERDQKRVKRRQQKLRASGQVDDVEKDKGKEPVAEEKAEKETRDKRKEAKAKKGK